jgi:hypothetical protein
MNRLNFTNTTHPRPLRWLLLAASAGLTACMTPPEALLQANHATKLMSLLETQLQEFRRVQQSAVDARLALMKDQKASIVAVQAAAQLDINASRSAGDKLREPLALKLLADADAAGKTYLDAKAKNDTYGATLSGLLLPLPSTAGAMTQAQAKMAAMGVELDGETRFAELSAFVKDIEGNIEDNKKKIAAAKAAATKADANAAAGAVADAASAPTGAASAPPATKP